MSTSGAGSDKYTRMTTLPVERLVCKMAIPSIIIMMISAAYNMADTYFVAQIGTSATAGVGVSFSLMALIQALGFFFGHGSGNYISRQLGAKNMDAVSRMAATGLVSAWIVSSLVAAVGLFNLEGLARLLGSTGTILPYACEYLRFILLGAPWMAGSLVLNNLLRFQGSAVYGMVGMVSGAVLNIGLDPLFIFVFDMGVSGAALATMLSQTVSFVVLFIGCSRGGNIAIRLRNFTPRLSLYKEILRGGAPSLFRQGLNSVATILLNHQAGLYGDAAIAAISIVNRVIMFANSALIGFGQGFQPVAGFNYGAKRYDRVRRAFWFCVKVASGLLLFTTVVCFLFAPQIIAVFRKGDPEVVQIGTLTLRLMCLGLPTMGFVIMANMMLQTIGKAGRASILAASRQGVFLATFLIVLPRFYGLFGIQLSQPLADLGTFVISIPLTMGVLREMKTDWAEMQASAGQDLGALPQAPQTF